MKIRALVFEDEAPIRALLNYILKERGYEVIEFSDPSQCALASGDACLHACADILISDVKMPGMTGLEFIERQQALGCPLRNVALMSGDWTDEDAERAEKAGVMLIRKPFKLAELDAWLNQCEASIDPSRELFDSPLQPV